MKKQNNMDKKQVKISIENIKNFIDDTIKMDFENYINSAYIPLLGETIIDEKNSNITSIKINMFIINRIGDKYLCTNGIDKDLEGVEFMYLYTGENIEPYNRLCDYLNKCEKIDADVWKSILPRNPNVPKEISDDHISLQRHMKIKNILSK